MDLEAKTKVLRKITHGVYVVGVKEGETLNAFTATWLTQVSFKPPLVALGIRRDGVSYRMVEASRVLTVNFLGSAQKPLAQHFLKPAHLGTDKLKDIAYRLGKTGAPILEEAIACVECEVKEIRPGGDHAVVIAEVVEAYLHQDVTPLSLQETGWEYGG